MNILDLVSSAEVGTSFFNTDGLVRNKIDDLMESDVLGLLKNMCDTHIDKASGRLRDIGYDIMDASDISEIDILNSEMDAREITNLNAAKINFIAAMLCKQFDIGKTAGFEAVRMWIFYKMKSNKPMEDFMFRQVASHFFTSYGSEFIPATMGAKGGRPKHPKKKEAIEIAKQKWEQMEYASVSVVAASVKHQLEKKYTDTPSLAAIKKWINGSGIRPNRSVK